MESNQANNEFSLLPHDRRKLYESGAKVGTITFTSEELVELAKLTETDVWKKILKGSYVHQRLTQIAVTGITVAQTENDLHIYKGKGMEADHMFKEIERLVKEFKSRNPDEA